MADDTREQWKPVPGFEGLYEVSDHGNVRSLDRMTTGPSGTIRRRRGRLLRVNYSSNYPMIALSKNGKPSAHSIHRLVAAAFLGIPPNADELHVCHWDGDRTNNHVSNLRWDTPTGNFEDMKRHGRVKMHDVPKSPYLVCGRGHEMTKTNIISTSEGGSTKNRCAECNKLRVRKSQAEQLVKRLREALRKAEMELAAARHELTATPARRR